MDDSIKELGLLSLHDINPGVDQLTVLRDYKGVTEVTDLAKLCGYGVAWENSGCSFYTMDSKDGMVVCYWNGKTATIGDKNDNFEAIRPVLRVSAEMFSKLSSRSIVSKDGVKEVFYGEYPQYAPPVYMQDFLDRALLSGELRTTGGYYIFGENLKCDEYEYLGKKYIRLSTAKLNRSSILSNGWTGYNHTGFVWVEVAPVPWLVDDKAGVLVSKNGLLSGVLFSKEYPYYGNFKTTAMSEYLKTQMVSDLFQTKELKRKDYVQVQKVHDKIDEIMQLLSLYGDVYKNELYELLKKYNGSDDIFDELESFLKDKKVKIQKYNEYYKMYVYIKKCLSVLKGKTSNDEGDELLNSICSVRNFSKEIIKIDDFVTFLKKCEEDIFAYVEGNTDSPIANYKTLEEFKKFVLEKLKSLLVYQNGIGLTILTPEEVKSLEVLKKYDSVSLVTDLAILMGATYVRYSKDMHGLVGAVWLNSYGGEKEYEFVNSEGKISKKHGSKSYASIRPAFYAGREFSQLLAKSTSKYGILSEVTCGEYPQFVPSKRIQNVLKSKLAKGLLKSTGRTYTLIWPDYQGHFKPNIVIEYEYNDKKYVFVKPGLYVSTQLSSGQQVKVCESVWVEVTPVVWLIDKETKMLVSKYALMSGVEFDGLCRNFEFSQVGMFIGKYMARDIFQSTDLNKTIGIGSKAVNTHTNEKTSKIATVVEEIKILLSSYYGHEDIMGKVEALINKYNSDIDKAYEEKSSGIVLKTSDTDKDFLYAQLISDLEDILSDVKRSSEKYIEYTKMLELTKKCIDVLNGNDVEDEDDDLIKDIITIKKVVLSFLDDESKKREIMTIFTDNEKEISEYLRGNEDSKIKKYKTLTEYKLGIRKRLQPYLVSLSTSVRKKDMVNEIKSGYVKMLDGLFVKCKDEYINHFLMEIKALIDTISVKGNSVEKQKMQEVLAAKSEFGDDLTKALTVAVSLYRDLYGIVLDIEEREKEQLEHDEYKIDIRGVNFNK